MDYLIRLYNTNEALIIKLLQNTVLTLLIIVSASILSKLVKRAVYKAAKKLSKNDEIVSRLLSKITSYLVYLIGLVIILDLFGVNTTSLVALMGAAGLAIGLALRDTLSNIAAGVMILFLKPFKLGEYVDFGVNIGTVKDIGLFTTEFETADGLYISSPNSALWNATICNYSRNPKRRVDIPLRIGYEDSIETAVEVLLDIAKSNQNILQDPSPTVIVQELADSSIHLQLRAWCPSDVHWGTYCELQRQVKPRIEAAGLTIPYPKQEFIINKSFDLQRSTP